MQQSISEIKAALSKILSPNNIQPATPFLWGKPGIGKSETVFQFAEELSKNTGKEYQIIDFRASQIESSDLKGIPRVIDVTNKAGVESKILSWITPEDLPTENNPLFEGTQGILFLDEVNRARPEVGSALFQLVNDRKIGKHKILDSWFIIAAGNLGYEDNTDVTELDSAFKNRFAHFFVRYTTEEWLTWAKEHNVHEDIIGYIRTRNEDLYIRNEADNTLIELVTPRSWVKFSKILQQNPNDEPADINRLLGFSLLGSASAQFGIYLDNKNRVSAKDVLFKFNEYKNVLVQMQRDQIQAICNSIAVYISKHYDKWDEDDILIAMQNYDNFSNDCLEKDLIVAFNKQTYLSCKETGTIKFMQNYLERYKDKSKLSTATLDVKRKRN